MEEKRELVRIKIGDEARAKFQEINDKIAALMQLRSALMKNLMIDMGCKGPWYVNDDFSELIDAPTFKILYGPKDEPKSADGAEKDETPTA